MAPGLMTAAQNSGSPLPLPMRVSSGIEVIDLWLPAATIEAGRIAAQQYLRTEGRLYVRVFPHKSITSIPLETRMGKGKGEPEYWAAVIKPGMILYEIGGVTEEAARVCMARLAHKMPLRVRFVKRRAM